MNDPRAADHLAEIDARHEAHVAAIRERAESARASIDGGTLGGAPAAPAPGRGLREPPPDPFAGRPLVADTPLLADTPLVAVDDDGIPLWDDPEPRP